MPMPGARFTIEGDGRTGRCTLDGLVTGEDLHVISRVIERHLDGLDVLLLDGEGVTASEPSATHGIAALHAACRPAGVSFVVRRPSPSLVAALDDAGFGEALCAGLVGAR